MLRGAHWPRAAKGSTRQAPGIPAARASLKEFIAIFGGAGGHRLSHMYMKPPTTCDDVNLRLTRTLPTEPRSALEMPIGCGGRPRPRTSCALLLSPPSRQQHRHPPPPPAPPPPPPPPLPGAAAQQQHSSSSRHRRHRRRPQQPRQPYCTYPFVAAACFQSLPACTTMRAVYWHCSSRRPSFSHGAGRSPGSGPAYNQVL